MSVVRRSLDLDQEPLEAPGGGVDAELLEGCAPVWVGRRQGLSAAGLEQSLVVAGT